MSKGMTPKQAAYEAFIRPAEEESRGLMADLAREIGGGA